MLQPKNFLSHPYNSVMNNSEHETVARNIMVLLDRTGGVFRPLSWEEYKAERQKDGNFSEAEKYYFDRVAGFCVAAESAMAFCPGWCRE